jgi:hypothetical protein
MDSFYRSAVYASVVVLYAGYVISNAAYRNVALNPNDVHESQWTPAKGYPHATSNSEYPAPLQQPPNPQYYALNAIDGRTANTIETQHPSWGPNKPVANLWWKVAFGKLVQVDSVVIWIRADWTTTAPVPHDSYWKSATLVFSDSSKVNITIDSTARPQGHRFPSRATNSLAITNLVAGNPNKWCAFAEVQLWGDDAASALPSSHDRLGRRAAGATGTFAALSGGCITIAPETRTAGFFTVSGAMLGEWRRGNITGPVMVSLPNRAGKGIVLVHTTF